MLGSLTKIKGVVQDEKKYARLLSEQRDLQKQKSVIDNRLTEIQNELNTRSEEINKKKSGVEDAKVKRANKNGQ
jgi:peptidoglycan hydrolase CwlO-like protein